MNEVGSVKALKHAQIIDAAVAEFREKGFVAASMDRISARAEVSKRTVYKYFESKEKLFVSIVEALSDRFTNALTQSYVPGRDIREQLTELAWAEGRLLISEDVMAMSRMIIGETLRNPELAEAAQGKIDSKSVFEDMLRDAGRDGALNVSSPEEAAGEFIALLKAKAFWPVIFGGPILDEQEMARLVDGTVEMMMCRYGTSANA